MVRQIANKLDRQVGVYIVRQMDSARERSRMIAYQQEIEGEGEEI